MIDKGTKELKENCCVFSSSSVLQNSSKKDVIKGRQPNTYSHALHAKLYHKSYPYLLNNSLLSTTHFTFLLFLFRCFN